MSDKDTESWLYEKLAREARAKHQMHISSGNEHRTMRAGMSKARKYWEPASPGERFSQYIMPLDTETGHNEEILSRSYLVLGRKGPNSPWKFVEGNDRFYYPTNETSRQYRETYNIHKLDTLAVAHARGLQMAHYSRRYDEAEQQYMRDVQKKYKAVVVGHNIEGSELQRIFGKDWNGRYIDTLAIMQNTRGPGGNSQPDVYRDLFGVKPGAHGLIEHRASEDTISNARIFTEYLRRRGAGKTARELNYVLSTPGASYSFRDSYTGDAIVKDETYQLPIKDLIDPETRKLKAGWGVEDISKPPVDEMAGDTADQFLQEAIPHVGGSSSIDASTRAELQKAVRAIAGLGESLTRNSVAMESSALRSRPQQINALAGYPRQQDWDEIMSTMGIPSAEKGRVAFAARAKQDARNASKRAALLAAALRSGYADIDAVQTLLSDSTFDKDLSEVDRDRITVAKEIAEQKNAQAIERNRIRRGKAQARYLSRSYNIQEAMNNALVDGAGTQGRLDVLNSGILGATSAGDTAKATQALVKFNHEMQELTKRTSSAESILKAFLPTDFKPHLYDPMRMVAAQEQGMGDITGALSAYMPASISRGLSRLGQGIGQHQWVNAITRSHNVKVLNPLMPNLGAAAGGVAGLLGGNPLIGAMIGSTVGQSIQTGIDLYHYRQEESFTKPMRTIAGNLNILSMLTVPLKLFQDMLKSVTFSLGNFGARLRSSLDDMKALGVPLTHLTGVQYAGYQQSTYLDAGLGLKPGSTNSVRESIAMMSRNLMTRGQVDQNKLVASAMLGVFDDVYVKGDYNSMMNKLLGSNLSANQLSWLNTISPEAAQSYEMYKLMGVSKVPTSPSAFHYIYSRSIEPEERGRFGKNAYEWEAQKQQLQNTKLRFADFIYNNGGRTLFNGINAALDKGMQGDWRGAISSLKEGVSELWSTIAKAITGSDDATIGEVGDTIWAKIKAALDKVDFSFIGESLLKGVEPVLSQLEQLLLGTVVRLADTLSSYKFELKGNPLTGMSVDVRKISWTEKDNMQDIAQAIAGSNYVGYQPGHNNPLVWGDLVNKALNIKDPGKAEALWAEIVGNIWRDADQGHSDSVALREKIRSLMPVGMAKDLGLDVKGTGVYQGAAEAIQDFKSGVVSMVKDIQLDISFKRPAFEYKIPVTFIDAATGRPLSAKTDIMMSGAVRAASSASNN